MLHHPPILPSIPPSACPLLSGLIIEHVSSLPLPLTNPTLAHGFQCTGAHIRATCRSHACTTNWHEELVHLSSFSAETNPSVRLCVRERMCVMWVGNGIKGGPLSGLPQTSQPLSRLRNAAGKNQISSSYFTSTRILMCSGFISLLLKDHSQRIKVKFILNAADCLPEQNARCNCGKTWGYNYFIP